MSLIDLAPTILDEVGIAIPRRFQGTPLDLDDGGALAAFPVYGEYPHGGMSAVVEERFKLLRTREREEIYDLARDPGEREDLAGTSPRRPRLAARVDEFQDVNARLGERLNRDPSEGELDEETLRQLESLGYID